ncbi:MAG: O-antigen ligase family protein [Acidimicrobiales bacterium]
MTTALASRPGVREPGATSGGRVAPTLLVVAIVGTWGLGKGFAYVGYYPVFISEMLLVGVAASVLRRGPLERVMLSSTRILPWLFFVVALQIPISVGLNGQPVLEVVRNIAPLFYSAFAYLTFTVLARRCRRSGRDDADAVLSDRLVAVAVPVVLALLTLSVALSVWSPVHLPSWPKVGVPVLVFKPGDAAIPLMAVVVLWFQRRVATSYAAWSLLLLVVCASRSRAVVLVVAVMVLCVKKHGPRLVALTLVIAGVMTVLVLTDAKVSLGGYREVSGAQLLANAGSLLGLGSAQQFDPTGPQTTSWRLRWWSDISTDSAQGRHPVLGLGWGTNLADTYGFETGDPRDPTALRSPHNILMSLLGRGGWAPPALWTAFYVVLIAEMRRARRLALRADPGLVGFLDLCTAVVVCGLILGMTDVFLESPQNAVPHWIIVGAAWFAIRLAHSAPRADSSDPVATVAP